MPGLDQHQAAGIPHIRILGTAGESVRIAVANPVRVRWLLQNQGPGLVYFSPIQPRLGEGLLLRVDGVAIDTSLYSQGELWIVTDTANTKIVFAEWSDV